MEIVCLVLSNGLQTVHYRTNGYYRSFGMIQVVIYCLLSSKYVLQIVWYRTSCCGRFGIVQEVSDMPQSYIRKINRVQHFIVKYTQGFKRSFVPTCLNPWLASIRLWYYYKKSSVLHTFLHTSVIQMLISTVLYPTFVSYCASPDFSYSPNLP